MNKIIAFVPARCGSKTIARKNIRLFCGRPLIYWSLEALDECESIDQIIVATDCDEIADIVDSFHFPNVLIYRRRSKNAQDDSTTESVMLEYINKSELSGDIIFMLVQVTSPLTTAEHFAHALAQFQQGEFDSMLSAVHNKRFFWNAQGVSLNYSFRERPRRQDFSGQWQENGAFYISTVKAIIASENRLSGSIKIYEMPEHTALELDSNLDWFVGEQLMKKFRIKNV